MNDLISSSVGVTSRPRLRRLMTDEAANSAKEGSSSSSPKEPDDRHEEEREELCRMADKLLGTWSSLKEAFKIPKKERIELMNEHEREVEKSYREYTQRKKDDERR